MPWTSEQASGFNKNAKGAKAQHWADQANAVRASLKESGKDDAYADRVAIATASKHIDECTGKDCQGAQPPYEDSPYFPSNLNEISGHL